MRQSQQDVASVDYLFTIITVYQDKRPAGGAIHNLPHVWKMI
jgi:hypothetical protein